MALSDTVRQFFECYRTHDVQGMLALFAPGGTINYYPAALPDLRRRLAARFE